MMNIEKPNCIGCHHIHPDNGNCTAVGGFCTAVPAANCPLIPELRAENEKMRAELEQVKQESDAAVSDKDEISLYQCKKKPITNADRIRQMTDDEMANFLDTIYDFFEDGGGKIVDGNVIYPGNMLDWLQQPAEGEEDT